MINVVIYTAGYDTGGQGYRLKRALERYHGDEFKVTSIHTSPNYFRYPADVVHSVKTTPGLFAKADVIHMRNGVENLLRWRPDALRDDIGIVCHWHGTRFREDHQRLYLDAQAVGAIQLVSTIDLALLEPGLTWLPSPIDMAEMAVFGREGITAKLARGPNPERVRFCHAPTNREVKGTEAIMQALGKLNSQVPVELDLIEKKPWHFVLERKSRADVYVDQLKLGYGNNALEAWAMGVPVVAGIEDPLTRRVMLELVGDLPFYETARESLFEALYELATDSDLRVQWSLRGLEYVEQFHNDRIVADQLAGLYRQALERRKVA